ncbi:hypothetical protein BDW22DRAFT_494974 [Trametopsis cervina]|nr:hypothetical protein BDW22DRAFT_494974 [Trametopsis cervina]
MARLRYQRSSRTPTRPGSTSRISKRPTCTWQPSHPRQSSCSEWADALQASQMDPVYSEPFRSENDPRVMYSCEEQYSQPSEEPVCPPQDMAHRQVYEDVPFDALDEMDQSPTAHDHNLPPCGERRNPEYEYQDSLLFSDDYLDHLPACSASSHLNYLPMNHLGHNFGHSYACDRSETPGSYELLGSFDDNDSISYLDDNPEYIDAPWQSCDSYYNAPYDEVALEPQATEELYEDPNDLADTVSYFSADEDYAYVDSESAPWPCVSPQESLVDEASAVTSLLVKQRFRPRTLLHEYSPTSLVLDTPETDSGFMTGRLMLPTLAQVEEDVAKHMLHHWLPQKL